MDKEKMREICKKMMGLKEYRNKVIQTQQFLETCKLIDKKGLEDRKMETLQYIKKA